MRLEAESFNWTGNEIRPYVTVTYEGKRLVLNKDYELSYDNNVDAGLDTAEVKVKGIGDYRSSITLSFDILKGVIAILLAIGYGNLVLWLSKNTLETSILVQISGIFVIIGHTYPIYFGFKGGKGVATSLGILLTTNYQIGLICLVFAVVLISLTRMVSVGSLAAAILFPVLTLFLTKEYFIVPGNYFIYSLIIAIIVIFNHRSNIKRLLNGTENKISFKKKEGEEK